MTRVFRYGAVALALVLWTCLRTAWQPTAILSALLYLVPLSFALVSMRGTRSALASALFWLFFGGTYLSSAVEAYAVGLRNFDQAATMLAVGAIVSFLTAQGLVWASGSFERQSVGVPFVDWRWASALISAVAFAIV